MKNKLEREIKVLELFHNFYNFEQNHTLNDWMPRMVLEYTTGVAFAIAFMHFGYWGFALFIFFIIILDSYRYMKELNRKRKRITDKKQQIRTEILKRYRILGVDVNKFINAFEWEGDELKPEAKKGEIKLRRKLK